ncbi:uncharacterized protein [Elaeis guineensis]|uniref:Uncharacterized protein LOC105038635 n=1 Tax=Elaeis guineensis var. tenera TaxID=51953 RepID=A0A6I9QP83_ELAGV|nr:uncharacterized protein LOC105038635 [Elaeis guineensis]
MGMGSSSGETESPVWIRNPNPRLEMSKKGKKAQEKKRREEEVEWEGRTWEVGWPRKSRGGGGVMLEGYVEAGEGVDHGTGGGDGVVGRTKSLTDEDLEELKGCLDLGFGFSYEEIPELCNTLPALELCYSMSQRFLDEQQQHQSRSPETAGDAAAAEQSPAAASSTPVANWKISSPGDHPEEVKARLKYWAQAVACTVRLCN